MRLKKLKKVEMRSNFLMISVIMLFVQPLRFNLRHAMQCCAMALFSLFIPASQAVAEEACEVSFSGHFVVADRSDTIVIRPASEHGRGEDAYDCSQGFNIYNGGVQLAVFYADSNAKQIRLEAIDASDLNVYERTAFEKVCRNPDNGLDLMVFSGQMSGTAWGDRKNILFLYYDTAAGQFTTADVSALFVDGSCSLKGAEQLHQSAINKRETGRELYLSLRPPAANGNQFLLRNVDLDIDEITALFAKLNEPAIPDELRESDGDTIDQGYFNIEVMAENSDWRIASVYFEETIDTSWGVMLVQNRYTGVWQSFYDVPHEGSSKRYLFLPDEAKLNGNLLHVNLCTDCSWWGVYAPFQVNLETFAYRRLDDDRD